MGRKIDRAYIEEVKRKTKEMAENMTNYLDKVQAELDEKKAQLGENEAEASEYAQPGSGNNE